MESNKRIRNHEGSSSNSSYKNEGNNTKIKRNDGSSNIRSRSRSESSTVYDNRSDNRSNDSYSSHDKNKQYRERDGSSKELKELFVGNVIGNEATESKLKDFINDILLKCSLNIEQGEPVLNCRLSQKFGFLEFRNINECTNCLNLNGILFMGESLNIKRPSKYTGVINHTINWDNFIKDKEHLKYIVSNDYHNNNGTHHSIINNNKFNKNYGNSNMNDDAGDPLTRHQRELFVGNTTQEMTELSLKIFLGKMLQKFGLSYSENIDTLFPVTQVRHNGRFCFALFRSCEEAANCLNLNGIPFLGEYLTIKRPSKFTGDEGLVYYNYSDFLNKWLSSELKLINSGFPSVVLRISNVFTNEILNDPRECDVTIECIRLECCAFGTVKSLVVPPITDRIEETIEDSRQYSYQSSWKGNERGVLFVEMSNELEAKLTLCSLKGRYFDSRIVDVKYYPYKSFVNQDFFIYDYMMPLVITTTGPTCL